MCSPTAIAFITGNVTPPMIRGREVLEVGSLDVNGSVRPYLESLAPAKYVGVDIAWGPRVDEVCDVSKLVRRFGEASFDVVISTELVEHVRNWRDAFDQMKRVLRPGGLLVITTRSIGFHVHGYPFDFWRYEPDDMRSILADMRVERMERDSESPGVFVIADKPPAWSPVDATGIALYSVVTRRRTPDIGDSQVAVFKILYKAHQAYRRVLPEAVRARIKRLVVRK